MAWSVWFEVGIGTPANLVALLAFELSEHETGDPVPIVSSDVNVEMGSA